MSKDTHVNLAHHTKPSDSVAEARVNTAQCSSHCVTTSLGISFFDVYFIHPQLDIVAHGNELQPLKMPDSQCLPVDVSDAIGMLKHCYQLQVAIE